MADETTTKAKKKAGKKKKVKKAVALKKRRGEDHGKPEALIVKSQSSVEVKKDAQGRTSWTIKVYLDDPMLAAVEAVKVDEKLREKYGDPDAEA